MDEPSAAVVEGLAGALSGVLGLALTYPLLTVSTRLQTQRRLAQSGALECSGAGAAGGGEGACERLAEGVAAAEGADEAASGGAAAEDAPETQQRPDDAGAASTGEEPPSKPADRQLAAFPAALSAPPPLPRSLVGALLHLWLVEGRAGLFAGLRPACASLFASNVLYFTVYAALRDALLRASGRATLGGVLSLPVASAAGALNVLATNPLWVLVTRLQAAHRLRSEDSPGSVLAAPPSAFSEACAVYRQGGLRAFWAGCGPSLVMVSNPVVQFAVYEWLAARGSGSPFVRGAASKLAATLATYPYLVIKSRQQAAARAAAARGGPLAQLLDLYREEGLSGLYSGLDSKLAQTVLAAAVLFSTKESMMRLSKRLLRRRRRG